MVPIITGEQGSHSHSARFTYELIPNTHISICVIKLAVLHQLNFVIACQPEIMNRGMPNDQFILRFIVGKYLPIHCWLSVCQLTYHPSA